MKRLMTRMLIAGSTLWLVACGGVSEERVGALEAQVKQLREAAANRPGATDLAPMQERLVTLEQSTKDSLTKMGDMLEVLQREVTKKPAATGASAGDDSGAFWYDIAQLMGEAPEGVVADGDNYTVRRDWLDFEVRALALSGKAPKLVASKKGEGITIKGIKPKSLPDKLGLKNNDVIVAVNDKPLASVADLGAALRAADGKVAVKISRRKQETVLHYSFAK